MKQLHAFIISLATILSWAHPALAAPKWDTLIVNARIVDGTGSPWFRGAVAISRGRIAWMGTVAPRAADAKSVIDAKGRVLAPGFVDLMAQDSLTYLTDPGSAASKLTQGVTLHLSGEGGSPAPQSERTQPELVMIQGKPYTWRTYSEYFRILEDHGIPVNILHNVGAAQVRRAVMGVEDRPPTPEEMTQMKALVDKAMQDGAAALTTALIYPPGSYQTTAELTELAKVVAPYGGLYTTHMRNESDHLLEAIDEAISIGAGAGIPVEIYHLKAAGVRNWPLMQKALDHIAAARTRGVDITADIYPYIRNGIGLGSFVPPSNYANGPEAFYERLKDSQVRAQLRKTVETDTTSWENWYDHVGQDWNNVLITSAREDAGKDLVGLSVAEAAKRRGKDVWEFVFDTIAAGGVGVAPLSMNEEQKRQALRAPFIMFDSDSRPVSPEVDGSAVHPRAYGTFPRVLAKYVREERVLPLEDAIRRMTAAACNRLAIFDRGRIAPGAWADLVLFDPDTVQDHATFEKPDQFSTGMDYVWVNGILAVEGGKLTGARAGKALRFQASGRMPE